MRWRKKFEVPVVKIARTFGLAFVVAGLAIPAHGQLLHKKKKPSPVTTTDSVAPDKELYEKAEDGIKHGRYEVARLQLNTLLNAYPDSEYLAKAKLAVADSYFKEGGAGNLNLAVDEYKSFITFFPYMDEAAYAQMQIAMTHYRRMDKADRDRTESQLAEQEFQIFLQKYPNSPLAAESQQHLRDVQEALAEGDFRIASYYNTKKDARAAAGRLTDIANRYPLYSKADQVLWMLGNIWQKSPMQSKSDEQLAAVRKQLAVTLYGQLVQNYPLSPLAAQAKQKLKEMGAAIPQPDPTALARMQQEQNMPRPRTTPMTHVAGIIHSGPDVSRAARVGMPNMNPPDENGGESLKIQAGGMNISTNGRFGGDSSTGTTTGDSTNSTGTGTTTPNTTGGQQLVSSGGTAAPATDAGTGVNPPASGGQPVSGATASSSSTSSSNTNSQPASTGGTAQDATSKPCPPADSKTAGSTDSSKPAGTTGSAAGTTAGSQAGCTQTDGKESSSKKKKGIKKIIPWSGSGSPPKSN
jgi:outer membrane protein assembly factor BamD